MLTTDKVILGSTLDMETRSVMVGCRYNKIYDFIHGNGVLWYFIPSPFFGMRTNELIPIEISKLLFSNG